MPPAAVHAAAEPSPWAAPWPAPPQPQALPLRALPLPAQAPLLRLWAALPSEPGLPLLAVLLPKSALQQLGLLLLRGLVPGQGLQPLSPRQQPPSPPLAELPQEQLIQQVARGPSGQAHLPRLPREQQLRRIARSQLELLLSMPPLPNRLLTLPGWPLQDRLLLTLPALLLLLLLPLLPLVLLLLVVLMPLLPLLLLQ